VSIRTTLLAVGIAASMVGPALAAEDLFPPPTSGPGDSAFSLTGSLTGTSEYFFRGLSQSDDKPAVQGGINAGYKFNDAIGVTAGVWASNVDFAPDARVEVDYLAGLGGTVMGVTWGAGATYYTYPGSENGGGANEDFDWLEYNATLGYDFGFFTLGALAAWTPAFQAGANQTDDSGDGTYLQANIKIPAKYVDIVGSIGKQWIERNSAYGVPDYRDYKIGVQALVYGFLLEAAWVDTSLNDRVVTNAANNQFLFTVTRNF